MSNPKFNKAFYMLRWGLLLLILGFVLFKKDFVEKETKNLEIYNLFLPFSLQLSNEPLDIAEIKEEIKRVMINPEWDDGSYAPLFIRLAWHSSGTYDRHSKTGGSNGATMRYPVEANDPENNGLHIAREVLESVKRKFPEISYSDLWVLAAYVALEETNGPVLEFKSGRIDKPEEFAVAPGRLPQAEYGVSNTLDSNDRLMGWESLAEHIRGVFYRLEMNDREIVALIAGGHLYGRCHKEFSGYSGAWVENPLEFSNEYAQDMLEDPWMLVNEHSKVNGQLVPDETRPSKGKQQFMTSWKPFNEADRIQFDVSAFRPGRYKALDSLHLREEIGINSYILDIVKAESEVEIVHFVPFMNGLRGQLLTGGWVSLIAVNGDKKLLIQMDELTVKFNPPQEFKPYTTQNLLSSFKPSEDDSELIASLEIRNDEIFGKLLTKDGTEKFVKLVDKHQGLLYMKYDGQSYQRIAKKRVEHQMMLPSDMVLSWDSSFLSHLVDFSENEEILKLEFGRAFKKLTELGLD